MAGDVVTAQPGAPPGAGTRPNTGKNAGANSKRSEFAIGSQRREFKLMQVVEGGESTAVDRKGKPVVLVKAAKTGKVRPLTESGFYADRPVPSSEPPPWVEAQASKHANSGMLALENGDEGESELGEKDSRAVSASSNSPGAQALPYVYASEANQLLLTRGQFLELSEAKAKQAKRAALREEKAKEAVAMEAKWRCDPRMLPGWAVQYSEQHGKCYFVNEDTLDTQWKPPGKWPERVPTPPPPPPPIAVDPAWQRCCRATCFPVLKAIDRRLPAPPRWWKTTKRHAKKCLRPCCGCCNCCGCCDGTGVDYGSGTSGDEAREVVEALGLTEDDEHVLWEAFTVADWDGGGELSANEFFAWLGEPLTAFSKSIFRLADMDDSGLIDFAEFVKVVCAYASFEEEDIVKFGFDIFDEDGSGSIDEYEMKRMVEMINAPGEDDDDDDDPPKNGNLQRALDKIESEGDGLMDFVEFCKLCKDLPLVIYPAYRLQEKLKAKTLGVPRWKFVLWNLDRAKRVAQYALGHNGRLPRGKFKSSTRLCCESLPCCGFCVPKLPEPQPDYIDGLRPAASLMQGLKGNGIERRDKLDLSALTPPSFT